MKNKEFMKKYLITNKKLNEEGMKERKKKKHYMYKRECSICNKIILKEEAIKYNKESDEKICKSCFEKREEENNEITEIEEIVQKLLKEKDEVLGIVTEIEIRKLLEWGYNS